MAARLGDSLRTGRHREGVGAEKMAGEEIVTKNSRGGKMMRVIVKESSKS